MKRYFCLPIAIFLVSCGVYIPQTADIPLIQHKNDLQVDIGGSQLFQAGAATVSYGLTNSLAIQGYGMYATDSSYYYQGSVGMFTPLANGKTMEVYVGMGNGYGKTNNHDTGTTWFGNHQVYFTQLNYGKPGGSESKWDFGISLKAGLLHANMTETNDPVMLPGSEPLLTYKKNNLLLEPTGVIRVGADQLKLSLKVSSTWIPGAHTTNELPYFPVNASLGLTFRFFKNHQ